jgi:hypothetical protein
VGVFLGGHFGCSVVGFRGAQGERRAGLVSQSGRREQYWGANAHRITHEGLVGVVHNC